MVQGAYFQRKDGTVLEVNQAALQIFGLTREQFLSQGSSFHPRWTLVDEDRNILEPARHPSIAALSTGKPIKTVIGVAKAHDNISWVHTSATPLFSTGMPSPDTVLVTLHDITEQKHAEELKIQHEELADQASKAKKAFLANMSHEVRTPLNGIIGMTHLLAGMSLTPQQDECINMVERSCQCLLKCINDILDLSKIEARQLEIESVQFSLRDIVEQSLELSSLTAHEKGLHVLCDISPKDTDLVIGDSTHLNQVLLNLLDNAVKFTEQGFILLRVEISDGGTHISETSKQFHFSIQDTGIGIPREKQATIFESFTQADGSSTRRFGGTGLGLTISNQLVSLMRGSLWLESPNNLNRFQEDPSGSGTTVHFSLPLDCPGNLTLFDLPLKLRGTPVLVVEGTKVTRIFLHSLLESWSFNPCTTDNANTAAQLLQSNHFPIILIDCSLPSSDLKALQQRVQSSFPKSQVINLVRAGIKSDLEKTPELGRELPIIHKPIKQKRLFQILLDNLSPPQSATTSALNDSTHSGSKKPLKILVAEDNLINQQVALRFLQKEGHSASLAKDGEEALSKWRDEHFDLILMDVQMPRLDGLEATRAIRTSEKETGNHIPIIAFTAHTFASDREECFRVGMDGYVPKPFKRDDLRGEIQRVFSELNLEL